MTKMAWAGSPNSFYPPLYTVLHPGDVVDVPAEVLAADPGRWTAVPPPAEAKTPGKAQANTPEGEVS
jgi:hypothetical protein